MKSFILSIFSWLIFSRTYADVYVITYATYKGKTGHTAIALDNYEILHYEKIVDSQIVSRYDTLKTQRLTYFDLWPKEDSKMTILRTLPPEYNLLPRSSSEQSITIESLIEKGLPHRQGYLSDGILRIKTSPFQDFILKDYIKKLIDEAKPFNTRTYNCTDFCLEAVNFLTGWKVEAKEFIPMHRSNTPNKFYKVLVKNYKVEIVQDAGKKVSGSFIRERLIKGIFKKKSRK